LVGELFDCLVWLRDHLGQLLFTAWFFAEVLNGYVRVWGLRHCRIVPAE
jgi:hypothetical protein